MSQSTSFPVKYCPTGWRGPRAHQFPSRDDAFQQLVGDALRELFGPRASVAPTKGQDGSIDSFIEFPETNEEGFCKAATPQIIECKDHDDTLPSVLDNIYAGWNKVAEKLRRQASLGWQGHFEPWKRTVSYVYCVSAELPNQRERDKLLKKIQSFFDGLPTNQRPPALKDIRVLDWSDLRDQLDRLPRLGDRWLGTGLPLLPGHEEYVASLTQFRRYLRVDHLPFVPPSEDDPSHPKAIFARLQALVGRGGVLLKGVGGVGKSRTALEVAELAHTDGWRVLHALPGEPGVSIEDLSQGLHPDAERTLLVFDYLDQMPNLDLGSLRRRLLPEAERRGLKLSLLANLRPAALRRSDPERDSLFADQVVIRPSLKQASDISLAAIDRICPDAMVQLGQAQVRSLCGERPIIAILIAEELQRRASSGSLIRNVTNRQQGGDLTSWLRRRLAEDNLIVKAGDDFTSPEPQPALIGAAAALAAAPMNSSEIHQVTEGAYRAAGGNAQSGYATRIITTLRELGWLEERGADLATPHDVVADEVLAQVVWAPNPTFVRAHALGHVLAPGLSQGRALGRFATALSRLIGAGVGNESGQETLLHEHAKAWLNTHATTLGTMLAAIDPDESAYSLGALIGSPAWAAACLEAWDSLVVPWLVTHGRRAEARHLLYRGFKELPQLHAASLLNPALTWLHHHGEVDTASYVLGPLIARKDLGLQTEATIQHGLSWLNKFWNSTEAPFVISPLLAREDLERQAGPTIQHALGWLDRFGTYPDAMFVFAPLLARKDLGAQANPAIQYALAWLDLFGKSPETRFVLASLLSREDLGAQTGSSIQHALEWLAEYRNTTEVQFVLPPLLARRDLGHHADSVIHCAMDWLQSHGNLGDAGFVLNPLLARKDLGHRAEPAIHCAMSWLQSHGASADAEYVLKRLFGHALLSDQDRRTCVELALLHLQRIGPALEASHLLKSCLSDRALTLEARQQVEALSLNWINANAQADSADYIFNRLLNRRSLSDTDWKSVARIALQWLRQSNSRNDRDLSLASLLTRPGLLSMAELHWIWVDANAWLADTPSGAHEPQKLLKALAFVYAPTGSGTMPLIRSSKANEAFIKCLNAAARGTMAIPTEEDLVRFFDSIEASVHAGHPAPVSFALPALFTLLHQTRESPLWPRLLKLMDEILRHPNFSPTNRAGMARSTWHLLQAGQWPENQYTTVLEQLGLTKPPPRVALLKCSEERPSQVAIPTSEMAPGANSE